MSHLHYANRSRQTLLTLVMMLFAGVACAERSVPAPAVSASAEAGVSLTPISPLATSPTETENVQILMSTSAGDITLELYPEKAPKTVANYLSYVDDGSFSDTIYHRVIKDFMIQGGGFTTDFKQKPTKAPVENEADNGLQNDKGTIAMARTSQPHSATAQFFINLKDNDFLNHTAPNFRGWGYTVFGKVIDGMDVVEKIGAMPTGSGGPFPTDVPKETVIIRSVTRVEAAPAE